MPDLQETASGGPLVLYEVYEGFAQITLNRPDKHNALNLELLKQLSAAFDRAESDPGIQVVVLAGAGKAFCAGADVREMQAVRTLADGERWVGERALYLERVGRCPKPVIAAIHGYALGGGLELAMQADLRVCGQSAWLGQPEIRLGLMPGAGGTQRLTRLIGLGRALEWLMTGERMGAEEALRVGLVNRVVPDDQVVAVAHQLARALARQAPLGLLLIKRCAREGLEMPLPQALAMERQAFAQLLATRDGQEGIRAFLEKREPRFEGC